MKFNWPKPPERIDKTPRIGYVYPSKNTHVTAAWVIVSIRSEACHMLGLNSEGEITSTQSYNLWVLERRNPIGYCDLSDMCFNIEPIGEL